MQRFKHQIMHFNTLHLTQQSVSAAKVVLKASVCVWKEDGNDQVPYGERVAEDLVSWWKSAGSEKAVGVRNPHRCEVSRKQSPGFMLPAGDGRQHRAGKVGYLVVFQQYIFLVTVPLILFLLPFCLLQLHPPLTGWRAHFDVTVNRT